MTAAAEAAGVRPGMRLGEALATCPRLVLVDPDPASAEQAWEEVVRSLEDAGFAVEPAALGVAYFETRGVERLYGGLEQALRRAIAATGTWDARIGAAGRRFAALAAASVAKPGQLLVVRDEEVGRFLAPLPLTLLPLERQRYEELEALGVRRLGQLAGLPGGAVAERLGPDGRRAWGLARGGAAARVRGRRPPAELAETLEFPEAVGNELTLRRALGALVETVLARPERRDRFVRKVALGAGLVGGGSWRRTLTLREPSADAGRIRVRARREARRASGPGDSSCGSSSSSSPSPPAASSSCSPPVRRTSQPAARRSAPGPGEHGIRIRLLRRRGRTVVADSRDARAVRTAGRLNAPRPARVRAHSTARRRRSTIGRSR